MNNSVRFSSADLADRSLQLVALSMFVVAMLFVLSIVEFFSNDTVAGYIDIVMKVLAVGIILLMALLITWKFRGMSRVQRRQYLAEDGFLQIGFQRAMAKSWMISFVLLIVLQTMDRLVLERLPDLPLELVIEAVLALMLSIFSIAFFIFTRTGSDNDGTGESE